MKSRDWACVGVAVWSMVLGACGDNRISSDLQAGHWRSDGATRDVPAHGTGTGGSATGGGAGGASARSGGHGETPTAGAGGSTGGGTGTGSGGAGHGGSGGMPPSGGTTGTATGGAGVVPSGSGGQPSGGAPGGGGSSGTGGATGGAAGTGNPAGATGGRGSGGAGTGGSATGGSQTGGAGTGGNATGGNATGGSQTGGAGTGGSAGAGGQGNAGGTGGQCPAGMTAQGGAGGCHDACADTDSDRDGVNDCLDRCPGDATKVNPGICGCGNSDGDGDLDGVVDCRDACPTDPTRAAAGPCGAGPAHCDLTWMTVSNIYAEMGPLSVMIDGYLTRILNSNFYGGGGGLQNTNASSLPDVTAVSQVLAALGGSAKIDLLLTGHSHFDHSFDTGTWSYLTGAPIIGSRTTCLQAVAQGIPSQRCTEVLGGEKILISPGVTLRVIRWNHSGDSASNPEQHNPVELAAAPIPDAIGGLRAGVAEDFPNGGGGRAFLFTIDGVDGPYSWFFTNSAGAIDLDVPVMVGGINYGAPLQNLKAAMVDAQLAGVDLWVGAGGDPVARLVLPVIKPKAYLPVHWDNFFAAFRSRPPAYNDPALATTLSAQGVTLIKPVQAMDKWRLDRKGVQPISNTALKQALNIQ